VRVAKIGVPASPQNKVRDHLMTRPEMPKKKWQCMGARDRVQVIALVELLPDSITAGPASSLGVSEKT
jgi:hypothetical protein